MGQSTAGVVPATHPAAAKHNNQIRTAASTDSLAVSEQNAQRGPNRQDQGSTATTLQTQDSISAQSLASNSSSGQSNPWELSKQAQADKFNPNNAAYDPEFAAQHSAWRAKNSRTYAHHKARKARTKLLKRGGWTQNSSLTAEEHAYLLDLQGD